LYGYTANSELRKSPYSASANAFTATITGNANGQVTITMSAATTANLRAGRYLYDVLVTSSANSGGNKIRAVEGIVNVLPGVTRT